MPDGAVIIGGKGQCRGRIGLTWYVTRMRFVVSVEKMPPPTGWLGRLRKGLALWLWPQLRSPQVEEGVMEYTPVRGTD